ncbi:MAG: AAA family ATPase [Candidatus Adlerbacteria bacterium]|nr:AAA family ATPase [Candidatus Adlerbacteria bacterium]
MIIGITGTLGAGKGTAVEYLKTKGFVDFSSSGILKEILAEKGLPATRKNLSELADELMKQHQGGVLSISHERAQKNGLENYILEAIHRVDEANYVKSIGGIVWGVDADIELRFERITKRKEGEKDNVTFEQFLADSKREDEGGTGTGPNIRAVLAISDHVFHSNGSKEELYVEVEEALQEAGFKA